MCNSERQPLPTTAEDTSESSSHLGGRTKKASSFLAAQCLWGHPGSPHNLRHPTHAACPG